MAASNQRLDSFISEMTSGEPTPLAATPEQIDAQIWSGQSTQIDERTFLFYRQENAGPPKMAQDDWFIFSDARDVQDAGILFWQRGEKFFARRLDQEEWEKFIKAARIKKKFW